MIVTQRGVLPPVQFLELDSSLRNSILAPAGTKLAGSADIDTLTATLQSTAAVGLQIDNDSGIIRFRTAAGTPVLEIEGDEISTNSIRTIGGKQLQIQDNNLVARLVVNATDGNVRVRSGDMNGLGIIQGIVTQRISLLDYNGVTSSINRSLNIVGVVKNSTGSYTVTLPATAGSFPLFVSVAVQGVGFVATYAVLSPTSVRIDLMNAVGGAAVDASINVIFIGP